MPGISLPINLRKALTDWIESLDTFQRVFPNEGLSIAEITLYGVAKDALGLKPVKTAAKPKPEDGQ